MPIYEYACESCSHDFEKLMRYSDPKPACPECGAAEVKKKVSAAAFALKGGGWYKDGYSGAKKGSDGGSKSSEGGSKSSDSGSKSSDGGSSSTKSASTSTSDSGS